jgi:hypothetical protein
VLYNRYHKQGLDLISTITPGLAFYLLLLIISLNRLKARSTWPLHRLSDQHMFWLFWGEKCGSEEPVLSPPPGPWHGELCLGSHPISDSQMGTSKIGVWGKYGRMGA